MSSPSTIVLPGIVSQLERFLRPLAATSGDGVQIHQDANGTTVIACEGRHAATITTRATGSLEPILVDPVALAGAGADASQSLKLYRLSPTSGVIARSSGELVTITITPGELPPSARNLADVVEGEVASGSTRAAFELDPRHLQAVAESLVATGAEKVTVVIAPRWNVLAATAETDEISATFLVAGEEIATPAPADDRSGDAGPLDFTIGDRARHATPRSRSAAPKPLSIPDDEIPF
jgi:hypothetical protein